MVINHVIGLNIELNRKVTGVTESLDASCGRGSPRKEESTENPLGRISMR